MSSDAGTDAVIVAGYDGSRPARAALRHALADARRRGLGVRVVTAYRRSDRRAEVYDLLFRVDVPDVVARAVAAAWACVDGIVASDPELGGVPVAVVAAGGSPATVLVAESRTARGLVIGRAGAAGAVHGPVARHCVLRARCPVTVVPAPASSAARTGMVRA